jgi:hypothetical protein
MKVSARLLVVDVGCVGATAAQASTDRASIACGDDWPSASPQAESLSGQPSKGGVPQQGHEHGNDEENNAGPPEVTLWRRHVGAAGSVGDFFWPRDGYGCIHGAVATPRNSSATSSTLVLVDSSRWAVHEKPTIIWFSIAACDLRAGFAQGQGIISDFAPQGRQLRIEGARSDLR